MRVIVLACLLLFPFWVHGEDFFVTDAGAGTNDGSSEANAWDFTDFNTAGNWNAADTAGDIDAGDNVYLCGTFTLTGEEEFVAQESGNATDGYIHIRGDCATPGVIVSNKSITDVELDMVFRVDKNYIEISNLDVNGTGSFWFVNIGIGGTSPNHIRVHDNNTDDMVFREFTRLNGGSSFVDIYDNQACTANTSDQPGSMDGVNLINATADISDVQIYQNHFCDFIHNGVIINNLAGGAETFNVHVYYNKFTLPSAGYGRAMSVGSVTAGNTYNIFMHHNYIDGMRAPIQLGAGTRDTYFHNNIVLDQKSCCVSASDAGCTRGYSSCDTYRGTGYPLAILQSPSLPASVNVLNNTFDGATETCLHMLNTLGNAIGYTIRNNIFHDCVQAASSGDDPAGSTCNGCDNTIYGEGNQNLWAITLEDNIIYNASADQLRVANTDYTVTEFDGASDDWTASGNVQSDPTFTNSATDDVTLIVGSPAIDTGQILVNEAGQSFNECWANLSSLPPLAPNLSLQADNGSGWEMGALCFGAAAPDGVPAAISDFGLAP